MCISGVCLSCLYYITERQLHNKNARGINIQLHAHQLHISNCWRINCVIIPAPMVCVCMCICLTHHHLGLEKGALSKASGCQETQGKKRTWGKKTKMRKKNNQWNRALDGPICADGLADSRESSQVPELNPFLRSAFRGTKTCESLVRGDSCMNRSKVVKDRLLANRF